MAGWIQLHIFPPSPIHSFSLSRLLCACACFWSCSVAWIVLFHARVNTRANKPTLKRTGARTYTHTQTHTYLHAHIVWFVPCAALVYEFQPSHLHRVLSHVMFLCVSHSSRNNSSNLKLHMTVFSLTDGPVWSSVGCFVSQSAHFAVCMCTGKSDRHL